MKITAVRTVVCNAEMRNWVFVRVETDQAGLYGWGEAFARMEDPQRGGRGGRLRAHAARRRPHPDRAHLPETLPAIVLARGRDRLVGNFSAIEQACWDILGKSLGQPVYKLLGGAVRDRVRMYTHLGGGDMKAVYESQYAADPAVFVDRALEVVARGYNAVKVLITPPTEVAEPHRGLSICGAHDGSAPARAWANQVDIMVDCHGRHSLGNALEFCRVLAPYRPYFVEEPVPPENVDVMAEVRRSSPVPIATGERRVTRYEFRELFEKQACHVIQPDLCHCGGLWEAKKIAAMAEVYTMGVAPHNPLGPIANAVALHFDLSTPNFLIQEDMLADVPWRWEVVQHSLRSEGGYWLPNDAPGLGIEVDEAAAAKHPFQQEVIHADDGAGS